MKVLRSKRKMLNHKNVDFPLDILCKQIDGMYNFVVKIACVTVLSMID